MKFSLIALVATVAAAEEKLDLSKPSTDPNVKNVHYTSSKNGVEKVYTAQYNKEDHTMISEMRKKFDDHFQYAFKAKGVKDDDLASMNLPQCSSSQECGDTGDKQMCCVNTVLHHPDSGISDVNYKCMTKGVVDSNVDTKIGNFEVHMKCVGSGASALTLGGAALLIASTLY